MQGIPPGLRRGASCCPGAMMRRSSCGTGPPALPGDSPWRMSADGHSEGSGAVKVIRHGRKVHYIASRPDGALNTFVADTSCSIKAYNLV